MCEIIDFELFRFFPTAEITPLSIRAAANGVSTGANWIFNFLVVLITPISFATIGYQTYIIFAVINAAMVVTTYLIFPETAGRSLEEMSAIFEKASIYNPYDVVRIEQRTPRRYDTKGRPLILDNNQEENGFTTAHEKGASSSEPEKTGTMHATRNGSSDGSN